MWHDGEQALDVERIDALARSVRDELLRNADAGAAEVRLQAVEVAALVRAHDPLLAPTSVSRVVEVVMAHAEGLGQLAPLLEDDAVSEVMVNGDGRVWCERLGRVSRVDLLLSSEETLAVAERALAPLGRRVDRAHPVTDARLADGSRLNVVVPPVAVDGPCLTIRRFRLRPVPLEHFCAAPVAALLRRAVAERRNVLVSGGTGAGKTTLLNALAGEVGRAERLVTIEDTAELRLPGEHVVRLEARPGGPEGVGEMSIHDLVRAALRMRPDRIVVGEVRGAEALAMLQAMNTGHEGSLSTIHANSPTDALRRLETMVLGAAAGLPLGAVREHIRAALDLVVQVARADEDRRAVVAVEEVRSAGPLDLPLQTRPLSPDLDAGAES